MKKNLTLFVLFSILTYAFNAEADVTLSFTELYGDNLAKKKPFSFNEIQGKKLIFFWRSDCPTCLIEIKILDKIIKAHADIPIFIISLKDEQDAQTHLKPQTSANVHIISSDNDIKEIFKYFGDEKAILPFSASLHADNSLCGVNYGVSGTAKINYWIKTC